MLRRSKLLLTALTATVLLGMLVGSASANRLRVSNGNFRITWSSLEFTESFFGIRVRCPVTLEGSFHSATISKVIGSLIGYVTRAGVTNTACTGGHATVLTATLPWHVTYEGFGGPLPNITSIIQLLRNASFGLEIAGFVNCLSRAENVRGTITGSTSGGVFTTTTLTPGRETIACREAGGGTVTTGTFSGTGNITLLGTTTRITVTLI
jgi:hypothetical protein